jgi:hypothetical protein
MIADNATIVIISSCAGRINQRMLNFRTGSRLCNERCDLIARLGSLEKCSISEKIGLPSLTFCIGSKKRALCLRCVFRYVFFYPFHSLFENGFQGFRTPFSLQLRRRILLFMVCSLGSTLNSEIRLRKRRL